MGRKSKERPWEPGEDRMLARLAEFGDVEFLAQVYNRPARSVEARLRELGIQAAGSSDGEGAEVFWCQSCKQPRSGIDALGKCPVCREKDAVYALSSRVRLLAAALGSLDLYRWRRANTRRMEEADMLVQRARRLRLEADERSLEEFIAQRAGRDGLSA